MRRWATHSRNKDGGNPIYRGLFSSCVRGTLVSCDAFQSIILKVTEEFRIEEGRESGSLRTIMLPLDNIWLLATDGPPSLTG